MIRIFSPLTPALAGRRTGDTRDDFCASVWFMSAGVLLRRPAHTKISCVGFRETQGQRVQISFGLPFFVIAKKVYQSGRLVAQSVRRRLTRLLCLRRMKV